MVALGHSRAAIISASLMGAIVFAIGVSSLAGWYLDKPVLLHLLQLWLPTQYNAALSLAFLGLGIVALALGHRRTAAALAVVPVAVGTITMLTWLFRLYPGIDAIFFRQSVVISNFSPGRMSPFATLCVLLSGLGLGFAALAVWRPMLAVVAWVIGVLLGTAGVLATALMILQTVNPALETARTIFLTQHSGIAYAFAGISIALLTGAQKRVAGQEARSWQLPIAAGITLAMVSLILWQSLAAFEARSILAGNEVHWRQVASFLSNEAVVRNTLYANIANRTARLAGQPAETIWEGDTRDIIRDTGWLLQVVWRNLDGTVRHHVSREQSGGALAVSELPIKDDSGAALGSLEFTVEINPLLESWLGQRAPDSYNVEFRDNDNVIYSLPGTQMPRKDRMGSIFQDDIEVAGKTLQLVVWPGEELIKRQRTQLPLNLLLFGVVLSLLLVAALYYEAIARLRATTVVAARRQLEREVDERRRAEDAAKASEVRAQQALYELRQILDQSQDLICTLDARGCFATVSASAERLLGYRPEEMMGRNCDDFIAPEDRARSKANAAAVVAGYREAFENQLLHKNGGRLSISWASTWLPETQMGYLIGRDVTRQKRQEAIRDGQRQVLQLIAGGSTLQTVLDSICTLVESIDPGSCCSVLVVDAGGARLSTAAAPGLPAGYTAGVNGLQIGPASGSCGTAVWRKQLVVVREIQSDPLWNGYHELARRHGLKSCWSMPIKGELGTVLGAFAVYHSEPSSPELHEIEMIEAAAGLAAVAIERDDVQQRLTEGLDKLEFARRIAQLGYWEAFLDSGRVVLSDDMLVKLGLPGGEVQEFGKLLEYVVEEDRRILTKASEAALKHDAPVDIEIRLKLPDGDLRYVHFRGRTIRREDGHVVKLAGTVQEVTARKLIELENARLYAELEDRVRSRTRELEQSNRELEAFSYSVSHDLRAPLRAISGFSVLLKEEQGPAMGAQGQHYLERIIAGTVRMSALIDDLLELGRVSRIELNRRPLDLSALVSAISGRLHERWPERVVDVEIQPEMVAWGDLRLLEIMFENLLENAWKFTGRRPVARIHVGSVEQRGEPAFFVADNGVGFDPQYAANLFGVFQRLHAPGSYPGTGVGLATVQRILQRHGGRVWANAKIDEGATFYFTLP